MAKTPSLAERYLTDANFDRVERLQVFARERGHSLLELAFSWLAAQPQIASIIAGATLPAQVEQNVKAVAWTLSAEEFSEVDRLSGRP